MNTQKHVLLGLSGGVDSAAAAFLLLEQNFKVTVLTFRTWKDGESQDDNLERAKKVAQVLEIDHIERDVVSDFYDDVVCPFVESWRLGETPNPCVLCNPAFKFRLMMEIAEEKGFDYIATGHYVRLIGEPPQQHLCRAIDRKRDQSYFLYRLPRAILNRTLFPLGQYTKEQVRTIASSFHKEVGQTPDSQDICFLETSNLRDFLSKQGVQDAPGYFLNTDGDIIGEHSGSWRFSEGQRRGLGIALGKRMTVLSKDSANNTVTLGDEKDAMIEGLELREVTSIDPLPDHFESHLQLRSQGMTHLAKINFDGVDKARVIFKDPIRLTSPGQSAVFYCDDRVLGGGIVDRMMRHRPN